MPYHGEWLIPLRVMEARLWGVVTLDDLDHHTEVCVRLLTEAQTHAPGRTQYLLLDAGEAEYLPPMYLGVMRALPVLRFKNRGPMLFVTHNPTFKSIMNLTAHVMHFQMRTFTERQEALQHLDALLVHDDIKTVKLERS